MESTGEQARAFRSVAMLKFVWHPYLRTEILLYDGKLGNLFLAG
jgi:hypothetical protein